MGAEGFKRKITALLNAEVVGYSKLMGDDEGATVQKLAVYKGVMSALIDQHQCCGCGALRRCDSKRVEFQKCRTTGKRQNIDAHR